MGWQDDPVVAPAPSGGANAGWQSDPIVEAPASSPVADTAKEYGRAAVATARDAVQGAADLVALPVNALYSLWNLATGRNDMNASQAIAKALNDAGIPETDNRYIRAVNRALGGGAAGILAGAATAGAQGVTGAVGQAMAANPGQQATGAITGATASQAVADLGGGPVAQTVAGLVGGAAGSSLRSGLAEGTKRSMRGGEAGREQVANNIKLFEDTTGQTPTAGQATQNRRMQGAESMLSRTPGGAGVMAKAGEDTAAAVSGGLEKQAASLSPNRSPTQAGAAILDGVSGDKGFVSNFKAKAGELYDKVDQYVAPSAQVNVSNTRAALAALNQEIKDAPELSKWFQNSTIKGIRDSLESDTAQPPKDEVQFVGGTTKIVQVPQPPREWMPYESIKKLRTLVGNEMADSSFVSDVPRSKWKALYGALTKDMEAAANASGPEARQAWSRANSFYAAGTKRIDSIAHVIDKAGGPEKVYSAALSGTADGATTLRAVMQSLPKDAQRSLSATVLRRLGRATAGNQDATGDVFSTETFLTNWNKLSPQAKATLFDRYGDGFRADMDRIARVAENLRKGSQVFRNPSGTAQATGQIAVVGGLAGSVASGNFGAAGLILSGVAASNLSARLLTHPPFVKWLAKTTQRPVSAVPASLNQLAQSQDPLLREAAAELQQKNPRQ